MTLHPSLYIVSAVMLGILFTVMGGCSRDEGSFMDKAETRKAAMEEAAALLSNPNQ